MEALELREETGDSLERDSSRGWFSNVPISQPVVHVDAALANLGGFVMTEHGIEVGLGDTVSPDVMLESLRRGAKRVIE